MTQFIEIGSSATRRTLAVNFQEGKGTPVVWLSGFLSGMESTKGEAIAYWAAQNNRRLIRFDYSGHGRTGGDYTNHTISHWLEEALAVITRFAGEPPILAGSSMGGWIATLSTLALRRSNPDLAPKGLVLLAPAIDFTESLVWNRLPDEARHVLMETGVYAVPSEYSQTPYRFTRQFIEDGRKHLILGKDLALGCPVRIFQGMQDRDVPWQHVCAFANQLAHDEVVTTLVRDGDHRLSREGDIATLLRLIEGL